MRFGRQVGLFAEVVALSTAACFILSGVANGAIFALQWRLNYFVIATPSDVVMTAFIFTLWAVAIVVVFTLTAWLVSGRGRQTPPEAAPGAEDETPESAGSLITTLMPVVTAGITLVVLIAQFTREVEPAPVEAGDRPAPLFSYNTGLRLTPNRDTGEDCWAAPVLWMGAERIVVGCRSGVQVISNADHRAFQGVDAPVPPRAEFFADEDGMAVNMPDMAPLSFAAEP